MSELAIAAHIFALGIILTLIGLLILSEADNDDNTDDFY